MKPRVSDVDIEREMEGYGAPRRQVPATLRRMSIKSEVAGTEVNGAVVVRVAWVKGMP